VSAGGDNFFRNLVAIGHKTRKVHRREISLPGETHRLEFPRRAEGSRPQIRCFHCSVVIVLPPLGHGLISECPRCGDRVVVHLTV
jgi:DNA-directed RNA polymerase subunit RPC12/RpoP